MKLKHPNDNIVFLVVIKDGEVMLPFIYPYHLRLNMELYIAEIVLT